MTTLTLREEVAAAIKETLPRTTTAAEVDAAAAGVLGAFVRFLDSRTDEDPEDRMAEAVSATLTNLALEVTAEQFQDATTSPGIMPREDYPASVLAEHDAKVVPGTVKRVTGTVADWSSYEGSVAPTGVARADVVTSLIQEEFWPKTRKDGTIDPEHLATALHAPVIDLDVPVTYVPSTTEGHGHLYLDTPMTGDQLWALLAVMVSIGLVEPGYLRASIDRGFTSVRLPWVKKVDPEPTTTQVGDPF